MGPVQRRVRWVTASANHYESVPVDGRRQPRETIVGPLATSVPSRFAAHTIAARLCCPIRPESRNSQRRTKLSLLKHPIHQGCFCRPCRNCRKRPFWRPQRDTVGARRRLHSPWCLLLSYLEQTLRCPESQCMPLAICLPTRQSTADTRFVRPVSR